MCPELLNICFTEEESLIYFPEKPYVYIRDTKDEYYLSISETRRNILKITHESSKLFYACSSSEDILESLLAFKIISD